MRFEWRVFTDTKTAEKVLQRIAKLTAEFTDPILGTEAAPYHKSGYVVSFQVEHNAGSWAEVVLEILSLVQLRGRQVELTAFVHEELEIFALCSIPGITQNHCYCSRKETT